MKNRYDISDFVGVATEQSVISDLVKIVEEMKLSKKDAKIY